MRFYSVFVLAVSMVLLSGCASKQKQLTSVTEEQKAEILSSLFNGDVKAGLKAWNEQYQNASQQGNDLALAELELLKGQFLMLNVRPGDQPSSYAEATGLLESSAEKFIDLDLGIQAARSYYSLIAMHTRGRNMKQGCTYLEPAIEIATDATDVASDFGFKTGGLSPSEFLISLRPKCEVASFETPREAYDENGRLKLFERTVKPPVAP